MAMLAVAVLANAALIFDALTLGIFVPYADAQSLPPEGEGSLTDPVDMAEDLTVREREVHAADAGPQTERITYERLIDELTSQRQRLESKARELLERERQLTVAREELKSEREQIEASRKKLAEERDNFTNLGTPNFDRLLKAYEGMDPENAASALSELYAKDRKVVIDILLGLKARQAAQALDALAAIQPNM